MIEIAGGILLAMFVVAILSVVFEALSAPAPIPPQEERERWVKWEEERREEAARFNAESLRKTREKVNQHLARMARLNKGQSP